MTTNQIKLSYVMTTYNKLPYLKEAMSRLIANLQPDEEIVVTDGASTDGTVEYLSELYQQGKIHQFISEPDKGEAHGLNKGMLIAKGELIKIITDDDVFYYPAIQECKKFMQENLDVDILSGNLGLISIATHFEYISILKQYEFFFKYWLSEKINSCFFCGLPILIRKNRISKLGLFDTSFIHVDLEYSMRITNLKANIAWSTSVMVVAFTNINSNSQSVKEEIRDKEMNRINSFYENSSLIYEINQSKQNKLPTLIKLFIKLTNKLKKNFCKIKKTSQNLSIQSLTAIVTENEQWDVTFESMYPSIVDIFDECDKFLSNYNMKYKNTFLYKNQII